MKVVILMPRATQRGGAEQLLDDLLHHVQTLPLECIVVFLEDGPLVAKFRNYGTAVRVIHAGRLREVTQFVKTVHTLAGLIKEVQADLVFSWMSKAHLYGGWAAWHTNVPAAWYQHNITTSPSFIDRLITLLPARRVLACSNQAAETQRRIWPRRATEVVYPCVDLRRFDSSRLPSAKKARTQLGLPTSDPLIGMVGRLQRWKGIHVFVEAMARLKTSHPDVHGVVVGGKHDLEPDYADAVKHRIDELDLNDTVRLAGYQSNVPLWMQAMDVVVHASDNEPFGMVVIEAMALLKPVVAGASGGPQEIITEEENGLLAPYGDSEALARQIIRYLDEPAFAASIARAARKRALDFSPARYANRFVEVLRDTLDTESESTSSVTSRAG